MQSSPINPKLLGIGFCFLLLTGCANAKGEASISPSYVPTRYSDYEYEEENEYEPQYFGDYECTDDCSGHEAGYAWAEDEGIEDPDDCDGNSDSFIEGCIEYAEEQQSYYEDDYGYEDEDYYEDDYGDDYYDDYEDDYGDDYYDY